MNGSFYTRCAQRATCRSGSVGIGAISCRLNGNKFASKGKLAGLLHTPSRQAEARRISRDYHHGNNNGAKIVCMANSRRIARVSKQIEREIGALFISDKVVQEAICPERRRGVDDSLSALASITEVEISNDLQVAKVYLSIYSDAAGKAVALKGLQRLEGYVRKHIGRQIRLRLTPEIRFILDESMERSERVLSLLKQVEQINAGIAAPPPVTIAEDEIDEFGEFYEGNDEEDESFVSVDLGFYEEEGKMERSGSKQSKQPENEKIEKEGTVSLSDGDVDEMLAMFRQDASNSARSQKKKKKRESSGGSLH